MREEARRGDQLAGGRGRATSSNDGALRETLMKRFKLDGGQFKHELGAERICRGCLGHDVGVLLADLAAVSETVAATSARGGKVEALAEALRLASPEEAAIAVAFLSGELRQRQIGVGWAALRELPRRRAEPSLTVGEVDAAFARDRRAGRPGLAGARGAPRWRELFGRATEREQRFLRALLSASCARARSRA